MAKLTEVYITVRFYTEETIGKPHGWAWDVIENLVEKNFNEGLHLGKPNRNAELVLAQHMVDGVPVVVFKKEK